MFPPAKPFHNKALTSHYTPLNLTQSTTQHTTTDDDWTVLLHRLLQLLEHAGNTNKILDLLAHLTAWLGGIHHVPLSMRVAAAGAHLKLGNHDVAGMHIQALQGVQVKDAPEMYLKAARMCGCLCWFMLVCVCVCVCVYIMYNSWVYLHHVQLKSAHVQITCNMGTHTALSSTLPYLSHIHLPYTSPPPPKTQNTLPKPKNRHKRSTSTAKSSPPSTPTPSPTTASQVATFSQQPPPPEQQGTMKPPMHGCC